MSLGSRIGKTLARELVESTAEIARAASLSRAIAASNKTSFESVKMAMKNTDLNETTMIRTLKTKTAAAGARSAKAGEELTGEIDDAVKKGATNPDGIIDRMRNVANKIADKMPDLNRENVLAAVKILLAVVVIAGSIAIVKSYVDKAEEEREVCLANWTTKYVDVLTRPDGTLHQIDTPEEWTQGIKEIQDHIYSLKDVNNDEAKATAFLLKMSQDLMDCLSIDRSPIGATLSGLSSVAGNAVKKLLTGATEPLAAALDSVSNNVTTILIAVGSVIGAIAVLLIVYYFTSKNESVVNMRKRHKELMRSQYNRAIALPLRLRGKVSNHLRMRQYPQPS
jgi:hypothetical protein